MTQNTRVIKDTYTKEPKKRIWELDFLRGFCILLMVMDHLFYNLASESMFGYSWSLSGVQGAVDAVDAAVFYFNGVPMTPYMWISDCLIFLLFITFTLVAVFSYKNGKEGWKKVIAVASVSLVIVLAMTIVNTFIGYDGHEILYGNVNTYGLRDWVQNFVLWIFFTLCGISCFFSKNNVKRTAEVAICAGLITLATYIGDEYLGMGGIIVKYGVLHMLATSVAIFTVVQLICTALIKNGKARKYTISAVCFVIGIVAYVMYRYLFKVDVTPNNDLAFLHETFKTGYYSSDYMVLLEQLPKVMFGCAIAPFLYSEKKTMLPALDKKWHKPVCFMGRHTLVVVLLHQLIITGLLALISYLWITPGSLGI